MDTPHRTSGPMPVALRLAIEVQMVWMAVAPGQHLLSHAAPDFFDVPCAVLSAGGDSAPAPWSSGHAGCAVCVVLAAGTCLPQTAPPLSFDLGGVTSDPLHSSVLLIETEPASSLQARAPPLV